MNVSREILGISLHRWVLLILLALGFAGLSIVVRERLDLEWSVESLRALVASAGIWGPLVYVSILAFRFAVLVPSSILLTAAGICFGALAGTLYATLGLSISALLKFAVASIAGRDFLLRQLPEKWARVADVGNHRSTVGSLALICAYPFGPKHVFQIAAILSGMSLWKYAFGVIAGANVRAGAFAVLGEAVATGRGIVLVTTLLLAVSVVPLAIPRWRAWIFSPGGVHA